MAAEWTERDDDGTTIYEAVINGYKAAVDDHDHIQVEICRQDDSQVTKLELTHIDNCNLATGKRVAEALAMALPHADGLLARRGQPARWVMGKGWTFGEE